MTNKRKQNNLTTNGDMIIEIIKHAADPSNNNFFDSSDLCGDFIEPSLLKPKGLDCQHVPCMVCQVLLTKWWDQRCYLSLPIEHYYDPDQESQEIFMKEVFKHGNCKE